MTVKELIAALKKSHNESAEVTVIDTNGNEYAPIFTVDEDGRECNPREVHIVLEGIL